MQEKGEIVIYQNSDDHIKIDVRLEDETVWLSQEQMALLFGKVKSTINEHIKNVYSENELQESETMRKFGNSEFSTEEFAKYQDHRQQIEREESLKAIEEDIKRLVRDGCAKTIV